MKRPKQCTGGRSNEERRYLGQLDSGIVKAIEFHRGARGKLLESFRLVTRWPVTELPLSLKICHAYRGGKSVLSRGEGSAKPRLSCSNKRMIRTARSGIEASGQD